MDNQVKFYSSGMLVRLGFAVAVHVEPDVLLIDEVLAVGDEAFQAKCLDRVRQFQREGRTIVLVTHALDTVREICDRAAMLHHGRLHAIGAPDDVVREMRYVLLGVTDPGLRPRGGHPRGGDRRGPDRPRERRRRGPDAPRRPAHDPGRRPVERAGRRPGRRLRRPRRGDEPSGARRADLARRARSRAVRREEARALPDRGLPVRAREVLGDGRVSARGRPGTSTTCRRSGTCSRSSTRPACRSGSRSRWPWRSRTCERRTPGRRSPTETNARQKGTPPMLIAHDPAVRDARRGGAARAEARHEPRERRARAGDVLAERRVAAGGRRPSRSSGRGLALFGLSALVWLVVLSRASLSFAYPFAALTYVLILLFDRFVLDEQVPALRWAGVAFIAWASSWSRAPRTPDGQRPDLAVVIVNYNAGAYLDAASPRCVAEGGGGLRARRPGGRQRVARRERSAARRGAAADCG